ncbi:MAG: diguanylate cyclase [archaeon]
MAQDIHGRRFGLKGKRAQIKNHSTLVRGLVNLQRAGEGMVRKEIANLEQMSRKKGVPPEILKKVNELKSLRSKRNFLMEYYLRQEARLTSKDRDFPLLLNRDSFIKRLKITLNKNLSKGDSFHSLVFFDIDSLKDINTKYGRIEGGHAFLITFSKALAKVIPKSKGFAGHVYGDEFLAYLPWPPVRTQELLETIFESARINELKKWQHYKSAKSRGEKLNYSAGILGLKSGDSVERALVTADKLCSDAKFQGREKNTFEIAEFH